MKHKTLLLFPLISLLISGCSSNTSNIGKDGSTQEQSSSSEDNIDTYYSICYKANGGSGSDYIESIKENAEYTLKDFMFTAPSNYSFLAWSIDNVSKNPGDKITVTKDIAILATYKEDSASSHIVTFNAGRGSGSMDPVEVDDCFTYKLPKCGFTAPLGESFVCWGDEDGYTYKAGKEVIITEDITFTAYYANSGVNVYTVSFASNGGTGSMPSLDVEEGLYTLPECSFSAPNGKTFDYWSIPNSSTKYQPGNSINVTGNVTITANWKDIVAQKYSITYLPNGGSGNMSATTGDENTWVYLAYCTFAAPSGKEFNYWDVDGIAYEEHTAIKLTKNFTATAIWKDIEQEEEDDDYEYVDLDCGYKNVGIPDNKNNPVELKTTLTADSTSWFNTSFSDDMNGYRYINGNNVTKPSTYSTGYLKINDVGQGFGSPAFTHTGAKLEIRVGIGETHNGSGSPKDKNKDVFRIYFFNIENELLGQINISGKDVSQNTTEIKKYYTESNASQVAYFEFRCNEQPHNTNGKYMNVGISYCNIKSWQKA